MRNHIRGGIMGLYIAEALGVPAAFMSREQLKTKPVKGMQGFGTHNQPIGTWSHDTSMTLCLIDSLASGLNYQDVMNKFKAWLTEGAYTPHGEVFDLGIFKAVEYYKHKPEFKTELKKFSRLSQKGFRDLSEREF